jgi:NitT/TauT family transport system permease protein
MWWNDFIAKVINPYLTVLNSLPKVALGPILIIWAGANMNSIIIMALLISVIITIINAYHGFSSVDENRIKLFKSFKATKWQIFTHLIIPSNINTIFNILKINVSMSLIGVIMGELLVSKEGLGYLIMYGSQVFNLNLVMTGIILLCLLSIIIYYIIVRIEKKFIKFF